MSGRWNGDMASGECSQDFTQATQEEAALEPDEYTQVEPATEAGGEDGEDGDKPEEPVPWGRLMRLAGGAAIPLMPRPEQPQGRAMNEFTLGRSKVCEVQVVDRRISSKHCRIYCQVVSGHIRGMEVYVEDMSANGTWVNQGTKLTRGARRLLNSGDEISLLNPNKQHKKTDGKSGRDSDEGERLLEAEDATYTFINLDRNRGGSNGRSGSLSVAETLRAGTMPEASLPALCSNTNGVDGMFGGARKVEDLYDVREMIGHGTSGEVRRAINRATGKQVAVKIIETRKFALTPGLTPKELVQEAEMLKRVDHEYIIKLEDIFQTERAVYLVMDLVSGGDLFDRIVEKGLYPEGLAQELLFRVLTAVQYLHSQDIVHRDLKPENILLVSRDNDVDVKITDFGLAKRANKEGLKTFCGTPQYFAPEVLKRRNTVLGVGRYGKEADMWSVGVILYILLSGTHPFHTTTLFDQITHASYSMDGSEWEHISRNAKDLVRKLLTENPKTRLTAEQALAHPFITERAGAAKPALPSIEPAKQAVGSGKQGHAHTTPSPPPERAKDDHLSHASSAVAVDRGSRKDKEGEGRGKVDADGAVVGRSSSQDTDVSSASADEISLTSKSLSPAEGGGGSAKAVPVAPESPNDVPPPRLSVPNLPPPHPREPAKVSERETRGGGGRRRSKKDGAGDKPPNAYSQLQMHRVGPDGASGVASSQLNGLPVSNCSSDGGGVNVMSPPASVKPRMRGKVSPDSTTASAQGPISPRTMTNSARSSGRAKRSSACVAHCAASTGTTRSPPARSGGRDTSVDLGDEIMEYSSDDSPAKAKRARVTRGQAGARAGGAMSSESTCHDASGSQQTVLKVGDNGTLNLSKLSPSCRQGVGSAGAEGRSNGDRVAEAAAGGAAAALEESAGGGAAAGSGAQAAVSTGNKAGSERPVAGKNSKQQQPRGGGKPQRTMTHLWKRASPEG